MACARSTLATHGDLLARAGSYAPVSPRSQTLCAALGVLAQDAARALGAAEREREVGEAASLLSLLTKIDDEVIDAASFHGGPLRTRGHRALRRATRRHLAPTLDSLLAARPADAQPRCELAAEVGRRLRRLAASPDRLDGLHAVICAGWETQVRAVDMLSRHPGESSLAEVARVTASISADWLLMITMVGSLPMPARRVLDEDELEGFMRWGWHIQRADALADFVKDVRDGASNTWASRVCFERYGQDCVRALRRGDLEVLESMLDDCAPVCLPGDEGLSDATAALRGLGSVPRDLTWIHAMLVGRWRTRRGGVA